MKSITLAAGGLLLLAQSIGTAMAAQPAMPPQAALCGSCHGPQGQGVEPLGPRLAGLSSQYIQQQIKLFQAGTRQNATMMPMAMTLQGDEVIGQVANYFSAQSVAEVKPKLRGEQVVFADPTEKLVYQGDWDPEPTRLCNMSWPVRPGWRHFSKACRSASQLHQDSTACLAGWQP